ncbi:MAG: carboxypeptidase regulatory-like domain-containing protein, partial [Deltaproteobacteria bacterium]|nr:carboxypeptidase regulatory-like domain-containing protein [Deltaproteobacteria bacterium]
VALENCEVTAATVELRPAGKFATPDDWGYFEIVDITPGTYSVLVTAAGHGAFNQGGVYCATGQRVDLGQIGLLAARGAIQGSARLELAPETEADSHGGVLVFAQSLDAGQVAAGQSAQGTVTEPAGGWTMSGLPVGTYQLSGSKEGYAPSPPIEVTVTEGETTLVPEMMLRSITGLIRIDDGRTYTNHSGGSGAGRFPRAMAKRPCTCAFATAIST